MKLIYVAGPYRGDGQNSVLENVYKARQVARILWLRGWAVICPHANTFFMDGPDIDPMAFIDGDLVMLERCDAICMISGWKNSRGAQIEHSRAIELGMPIYYGPDEVPMGETTP